MTDDFIDDNTAEELDPNVNYLEQLVGDGKKFKDAESLARGKYEADLYVKTLTSRLDELRNDYTQLRQDYNSRAKLEEVLDQMKTQQTSSTNTQTANDVDLKPEMKPEDLSNAIRSEIAKSKQQDQEEANFKQVQAKLKQRFGNNREALNQHLQDLGISEDFAKQLARTHPNVFMKTLGLDQQPNDDFLPPPRSNQRRDSFAPKVEKRTWAWWQNLKKTDPDKYHARESTLQMMKDYEEQGRDFEDGNFHEEDKILWRGR